jgi:hypothetical protein
MRSAEQDICQLLHHRSAKAIDAGRLEVAAVLFRRPRIEAGAGGTLGADHRRSRRHRPGAVRTC